MSSITGSCESPAAVLFQKGLEKVEEKKLLENNLEKKRDDLNVQASNKGQGTSNNPSNQNQSNQSQPHSAVGQLLDVFA